ncbi:hypothetical protein QE370_000918 [Aeromicrobium sp. SORGH_AS981]|uniref:hypothetical protein n=1 Tax=Aeromicrobium sp. SORGH_AS_0981 TaxID=3041802 RepID=UPI0028589110|nr:hypothetical protein [Aeromicrobium sp. SORGH_AS_0981]MDR6117734.1 hypothetical protein [Aeromicrobium sp. SORGH_AS_0981]
MRTRLAVAALCVALALGGATGVVASVVAQGDAPAPRTAASATPSPTSSAEPTGPSAALATFTYDPDESFRLPLLSSTLSTRNGCVVIGTGTEVVVPAFARTLVSWDGTTLVRRRVDGTREVTRIGQEIEVGGVVRSLESGATEGSVTLPSACAALRGAQFVKVVP